MVGKWSVVDEIGCSVQKCSRDSLQMHKAAKVIIAQIRFQVSSSHCSFGTGMKPT